MDQLMNGFPPSADAQVTLANWRTFPYMRWSFQHVRELIPSAEIANDPDGVTEVSSGQADFAGLRIDAGGAELTLDEFLGLSNTDGIVVLHRGAIVLERYMNGMTPRTPHILMSVSKSVLCLVAGILAAKGVVDLDQPICAVLPELTEHRLQGRDGPACARHAGGRGIRRGLPRDLGTDDRLSQGNQLEPARARRGTVRPSLVLQRAAPT